MLNKEEIFNKILPIFKSPVDAKHIIDEYSSDLLNHAVAEYDKWRQRSNISYHSINYFKKILQTGFYKHQSKGTEKAIKKEESKENYQEVLRKNEILHEIIASNIPVKSFLENIFSKLSENDQVVIKSRARNHLCYIRTAEKYDSEIRERIKNGENEKNVVEKFNNYFDILLQKCMLVEVRSQLIHGNYWGEAGIKSKAEIKLLFEV